MEPSTLPNCESIWNPCVYEEHNITRWPSNILGTESAILEFRKSIVLSIRYSVNNNLCAADLFCGCK